MVHKILSIEIGQFDRVKGIPSRRSTKKSSARFDGRKAFFSSFARLSESPPAVDVSRGAPFEVDIEKHQGYDIVSIACEVLSSTPNLLLRLCQPIITEWLRSEEGWRVSDKKLLDPHVFSSRPF